MLQSRISSSAPETCPARHETKLCPRTWSELFFVKSVRSCWLNFLKPILLLLTQEKWMDHGYCVFYMTVLHTLRKQVRFQPALYIPPITCSLSIKIHFSSALSYLLPYVVPAALLHCSIIFSPFLPSGLLSLSSYQLTSTTEEKLCISCTLVRPLQSRAA